MATSITTLALDIAAKDSVLAARAALAPIGLFARSFAEAAAEVGDTIKVPVFSRTSAAEFASGSNDYTSATSAGVAGVSVALDKHPWSARRLLPDDAMETDAGRDWTQQTTVAVVEAVAKYMANGVLVNAMKNASGSLTLSGATALAKVAKCRKEAIAAGVNPAQATLLLPAELYTDLLSELPHSVLGAQNALIDGFIDKFLGFARVAELQDFGGYVNNSDKAVTLDAMVAANDAIALATRLPKVQNADLYEVSTLSVPEVGPWSFQVRSTGTNAIDAKFLGAEVIFGTSLLQPGKVLVKTTTAA